MKKINLYLLLLTIQFGCKDDVKILETLTYFSEIEEVTQIIEEEMRIQNIIGMSVGIIRDGKIAHLKGYGYADYANKKRVEHRTSFRWASISKVITTMIAFKMHEEGKLSLDNDIRVYLPAYPEKSSIITLRHLLQNRSGIPHYSGVTGWSTKAGSYDKNGTYNPLAAIDIFKDADLLFSSGTDYHYSTFGFMLAGAVIDAVAKANNSSFSGMVEDIKKELKLTSLKVSYVNSNPESNEQYLTYGYWLDRVGNLQRNYNTDDISWRTPGGGFESNIIDIAKFCQALMEQKYLKSTSFDEVFTLISTNDGYGTGVQILNSGTTIEAKGHSGSQKSAKSQCFFYTNHNIGIVILCNSEHANLQRLRNRIAKHLGVNVFVPAYSYLNALKCDDIANINLSFLTIAIWKQSTDTNQLIRKGYSFNEFNAEWTDREKDGFSLIDITPVELNNKIYWNGIFTKDNAKSKLLRNYTNFDDFKNTIEEINAGSNYKITDIETYIDGGVRKWAGLMRKGGEGNHYLINNLPEIQFKDYISTAIVNGSHLVDMETYMHGGSRVWAAILNDTRIETQLLLNLNRSEFITQINNLQFSYFNIFDIEAYWDNDQTIKWSGFLLKSPNSFTDQKSDLYMCDFADWYNLRKSNNKLIHLEFFKL